MVLAAVIYAVVLMITSIGINSPQHDFLPLVALIATIGTFAYAFFKKRYESIFLLC